MMTYLRVEGGLQTAILAGSWCSLFPVRHRTFRPARRPMRTMSASDTLLKDKSKTWKEPQNVTLNTSTRSRSSSSSFIRPLWEKFGLHLQPRLTVHWFLYGLWYVKVLLYFSHVGFTLHTSRDRWRRLFEISMCFSGLYYKDIFA